MRRSLLAIPATAALSAGLGAVPAAFSSGTGAMHMAGGMPTHAVATGSPAAASVQLHRRVVQVAIKSFKFQPARLVVSRGTRIVWTNRDSDPHTIKSRTARWSSAALDTGGSYAQVARRAGTFTYICSIHPFMHATVVVK
jgi:plastocyanin